MRFPSGITQRITLMAWLITLVTLAVFLMAIIPAQKREFELSLESKARGVAASLKGVAAGAAVSEDYSVVVDQAMQVLAGDQAIDFLIVTKNDGFSVVADRASWKTETLDRAWRPAARTPGSSIGMAPLFGRRVFHYWTPFDYSGIQWGWIHVGLSLDSYDQGVRRTYWRTGALTLLCVSLSLVISLLYARRLVKPIRALHAVVKEVAQGNLHARAEVHSGDEIERLAEAFNAMTGTLLTRNQTLESVRFAAEELLSATDWMTAIEGVLESVGRATGTSRGYVFENASRDGVLVCSLRHEWLAPGVPATRDRWQNFPWLGRGLEHWAELLKDGHVVTEKPAGLEAGARALLDPAIKSLISVPILVGDAWWGFLGFDDLIREREWGDAEKDSLGAVADMLGASILRQRAQDALVEAKETLEQRVVDRTRELQNAQQLLAQNLERLDLALECAEEALWDWSVAENRTYYSERWSRMLGYSPDEIGDSAEIWERLVHPDDLAGTTKKLQAHVEGHCERYQAEYRMKTKDGGWRWIRARGKVVARAADGSPLRVTGTHLDITANKQADDALIELSRQAGMAEVATGVLHNVGNVLNSVNVATTIVVEKLRQSRVGKLVSVTDLLQRHASDLGAFLSQDPKGGHVLPYLTKLAQHLVEEREGMLSELGQLSRHVGHIKEIVAAQQGYASTSGFLEKVSLGNLMEDALTISKDSLLREGITVHRHFSEVSEVSTDKHKVLQIVLNLVRNAIDATRASGSQPKEIHVYLRPLGEHRLEMVVSDNGIGLRAEDLQRVFQHGFTTKSGGHGFGLHSGALAANDLGGRLTASSDGPGRGATFVLELPMCARSLEERLEKERPVKG